MTSVTAHAVLLKKKERICVCRTLKSSRSSPWVKTVVDGPQARFEDVRVNLRRRKIRMTKHHLDGPQIGAAFEQMCCKRMTNDMRAERARQAGSRAVTFDDLPESDAAQRAAACVDEQPRRQPAFRSDH